MNRVPISFGERNINDQYHVYYVYENTRETLREFWVMWGKRVVERSGVTFFVDCEVEAANG